MKTSSLPLTEEIARRAREIWSDRGSPTGCDLEIWLEAERQLSATAPQNLPAKPARKSRSNVTMKPPRSAASAQIDTEKINERLNDFGEPPRRSATSVDLT